MQAREGNNTMIISLGQGITIGGKDLLLIAGPCAIEGEDQMDTIGDFLANTETNVLRGGAFKPRTSPFSFQGLGLEGVKILTKTGRLYNLLTITEVTDPRQIEAIEPMVDILQIGSRNMQNYSLLKELGKTSKPVLLKRGMSATIEEWLFAASYIEAEGNKKIVLCERGIRTFETYTRNTLDLSAIIAVKTKSRYPIIVDPSHGTGRKEMIIPLAKAAIIAGADGLMIEVHNNPHAALCDGSQSLSLEEYKRLLMDLVPLAGIIGRGIGINNDNDGGQ